MSKITKENIRQIFINNNHEFAGEWELCELMAWEINDRIDDPKIKGKTLLEIVNIWMGLDLKIGLDDNVQKQ